MSESTHIADPLHPEADDRHARSLAGPLAGFLAVTLLASGAVAASQHNRHQRTAESTRTTAEKLAAEDQLLLNKSAQKTSLPTPTAVAGVQVLNGTIDSLITGKELPSYVDPILLTSSGATPDTDGNFLKGAYIGIKGNDAAGNIRITAVPFDKNTMVFRQGDLPGGIIIDPPIQATAGKDGLDLYAYAKSSTDGVMIHQDGTPVQPGLSVGMK